MLQVHWQSVRFNASNIVSTHVRVYSNGEVAIYDMNRRSKLIRWQTGTLNDLPQEWCAKLRTDTFELQRVV